ncbi:MAG: hypothetical protein ACI4F9_00980 [Lachnospiraceae bacterium]
MQSYATKEQYCCEYKGELIPEREVEKFLKRASRHIDSLTHNRIVGRGFYSLTPFQQDTVKEVCCMQADFEYENADILESALSGYSINGVSVQFGQSQNLYTQNGVVTSKEIYSLLCQTGLCCKILM